MINGFNCSCCGSFHEGLPLDYGAKFPQSYLNIPSDEREQKAAVNEDICVIENKFFFVRGLIKVPILEMNDYFGWGVWCSLSEKSFNRVMELWEAEDVENEPPFFGWLNTHLPEKIYPNTLSLKTNVYLRNNNQRPLVELESTSHLLAIEQQNGITIKRVQEIAEIILHPN